MRLFSTSVSCAYFLPFMLSLLTYAPRCSHFAFFDMKVHNLEKPEDAETVDPTVEYNKLRNEITLLDPPEGLGDDWGHGEATFGHLMGGYDAGKSAVVAFSVKAETNVWKDTTAISGPRYSAPTCSTRRSRSLPWMERPEGDTDTPFSKRAVVGMRWIVLRSSSDASRIAMRSLRIWIWRRRKSIESGSDDYVINTMHLFRC
jgi:hypothetical protein